MNFNLLTGRENNDLVKMDNFLIHKDVVSPFRELQKQAKDEIGADLEIVSSFRSFDAQLSIWNAKASGNRKLLDSNGHELNYNELSKQKLLESIMRWSAIPGASRHHWGTDFDVYDANKISKDNLQLVSSESEPEGVLFEFHQWLDQKLKGPSDFFRPYEEDLGGVNIEKWHLSYYPISHHLLEAYSIEVFEKNIIQSQILLKELILKNLESYFHSFIKNISSPF